MFQIETELFIKLCLANCTEAKKLKQIIVCDIIVICFSVIDEVSYEDVRNVWLKQIKKVYPDKPYLLVGTQIDKRQTTGIRNFQVESEQGLQLSQDIGAVAYFECSDLDVDGVETMFKYALQHVIDNKTTLATMTF
jgi:Ras family protein Q